MTTDRIAVRVARSFGELPAAEWDALTNGNPFVSHAFLTAMEDSGSVGPGTGWDPLPLVVEAGGGLVAALPGWLKHHSQGEYVFDHTWADAWQRAGGTYYPKLLIAAPFTPATGPRLLGDPRLAPALLAGVAQICADNELASAHATFLEPGQAPLFAAAGWLERRDIQFHWHNRGYSCFDDFLATLSSSRRKTLRKERAAAQHGVTIRALTGDDLTERHWDAFWQFYQDTGSRKWGRPYLTREAFSLLGQRMAERIVLVLAEAEGTPIAGALNFLGPDCLYGRYWGAVVDKPFLHFELCYYQAIEIAIARGLARVEAGAQGGHKLARGYEPVETVSMHHIPHRGFHEAVARFLEAERAGVAEDQLRLAEHLPFKRG